MLSLTNDKVSLGVQIYHLCMLHLVFWWANLTTQDLCLQVSPRLVKHVDEYERFGRLRSNKSTHINWILTLIALHQAKQA